MKKVILVLASILMFVNSAFSFDNSIYDSLNKEFKVEEKNEIIGKKLKVDDISNLSLAAQKFYKERVGCYFYKETLEYDYLSRNFYNLFSYSNGDDVLSFYLGKWGKSISYDKEKNIFYVGSDGCCYSESDFTKISDFSDSKYQRLTDSNVFDDVIKRKEQEKKEIKMLKVNEDEVREVLVSFFQTVKTLEEVNDIEINKSFLKNKVNRNNIDVLSSAKKDKLASNFKSVVDFSNLKTIDFDYKNQLIVLNDVKKSSFYDFILYKKNFIPNNFSVYLNSYYSENPKVIYEKFGECALVECPSRHSYFSFVLKRVDSKLKIVGIRFDLDEE